MSGILRDGRDPDSKIIIFAGWHGTGLGFQGQRDRNIGQRDRKKDKAGENGIPRFFYLIKNYVPSLLHPWF